MCAFLILQSIRIRCVFDENRNNFSPSAMIKENVRVKTINWVYFEPMNVNDTIENIRGIGHEVLRYSCALWLCVLCVCLYEKESK